MFIYGYDLSNIITWLLFGLVSGLVAHLFDPAEVKGGIVITIVIGLLGAVLGGILANLMLGVSINGFNVSSVLIAVAGSLLLLLFYRIGFRNKEHIKTGKI